MDKDSITAVADDVAEIYEEAQNTLQLYSISVLLRNLNKPEKWAMLQRSAAERFNSNLERIGKEFLIKINSACEKALILTYSEASGADYNVDVAKKEVTISIPEKTESKLKLMNNQNAAMMAFLIASVSRNHSNAIDRIEHDFESGTKHPLLAEQGGAGSKEVFSLKKTNQLYEVIKTNIRKYGGVENVPKVTYRNGREIAWKSYMEMNVRTTFQQEAGTYQIESGHASGVVFYLCSSHGDCAPDHAPYQGRLYYDEDYLTMGFDTETLGKIESVIRTRRLSGVNNVRDNDPWLTTRPHCRHYFQPIALSDVIDRHLSTKQLLVSKDMIKGSYDSEKYQVLQKQRYNERKIRQYKALRDQNELLLVNAPSEEKAAVQSLVDSSKRKVAEWQKKQRVLIKKHSSYLERDYDRESNKIIVQDLGYRFINAKK